MVPKQRSEQMAQAIETHGGNVRYMKYKIEVNGFCQAETRWAALETEYKWFA